MGASYFYYQLSKSYKVVNLNQIKLNIPKSGTHPIERMEVYIGW